MIFNTFFVYCSLNYIPYSMKRVIILLLSSAVALVSCSYQPSRKDILGTMKDATAFMMDSISVGGGFVWNVLSDGTRRWGEMEAYPTMIWLQAPSTPEVGQILLAAFDATGDDYYYQQALRVAGAIIEAQLPCGGWNYFYDYAGEESVREWYATIGRNGWRLEEFQHYYGNATFDDAVSTSCARFLLHCYLIRKDPDMKAALDKALAFVLESQYESGGWPQRYPLMYDHPFRGKADYSSFVTMNDEVIPECIDFLEQCRDSLGMPELNEPIGRAMRLIRSLQQSAPLCGWADQYTPDDLKPAHARSYEPRSINTGTTVRAVNLLLEYYRKTSDKSFLEGIPAALDYLESLRLPADQVALWGRPSRDEDSFLVPRFIDPDTGRPLYVHRVGSNVYNGHYFCDEDIRGTIGHYSSAVYINVGRLRKAYEEALSGATAPLWDDRAKRGQEASVASVVKSLDGGRWLSPLSSTSNPYIPYSGETAESGETDYESSNVGDIYDTSPYRAGEGPECVSTKTYINNMRVLIRALKECGI